jgi:hypothetical protein
VSVVVDILLLQTISIAIASAGVFLAAIYYVLQIRHQTKARQDTAKTTQADLLMRLYSIWGNKYHQKAAWTVLVELKFKDYDEYVKKYGPIDSETPANVAVFRVGWFFNGIGVLLQSNLADIELIDKLFGYMVIWLWEILKPIVEAERKATNQPKSLEWFEYLYNEMKKREQAGVKNG